MTPLDTALALAAKGVHVFWVQGPNAGENAKKPYDGTRGFYDSTTHPAKIRAALAAHPDSYLAVRTGAASKLTLIDFDGETGEASRLARNDWGAPRIHKTLRGCHYVYFTAGRKFSCSQSEIAPNVDVRGEGGYMIWWPAHGLPVEQKAVGRMPLAIRKLLKLKRIKAVSVPIAVALSPDNFARLRECLFAKDPNCTEQEWVRCIWAAHYVTGGSPEGLALCIEWSKPSSKFQGSRSVERKWERADASGGITGKFIGYEDALEFSPLADVDDIDLSDEAIVAHKHLNAPNGSVNAPDGPTMRRKRNGRIEPSILNTHAAVSHADFCGYHIGYDTFRAELMQAPAGGSAAELEPFRDDHYTEIRLNLERRGFDSTSVDNVRQAVASVAYRNKFDSAADWLNALQHDGEARCVTFLRDYFGAQDTEYSRAVSMYLWTALAARVLSPGCQADMAVIMVSSQGERKSTGISSLCPRPEQFVELNLDESDADLARQMSGCLVGELSELRGLASRDLESIKSFITRKHEKWVPKYKEFAQTYPRRLILIGTTNKREFLADETGERRFLPVDVLQARPEAIQRDRDQLWAEGRELYGLIGIAWQRAEELGRQAVKAYKVSDSWDEPIAQWLSKGDFEGSVDIRADREFTSVDVATGALGIDIKHVNKATEMRIARVLHGLGFQRKLARRNGFNNRFWAKT